MVFVGIDWAEAHHDVCLLDEQGKLLGKRRVSEGLEGVRRLHELLAEQAEEPEQVVVGIETDRGLLVQTLVAAGYQVYAINPLAVTRYRDRHTTSRAKSDSGDAKLLADLVRTDRRNHRPVAGDSEQAEVIEILARAHQNLIWTRNATPTNFGASCASSTPPPWLPSTATWPGWTRSPSWSGRRPLTRAVRSPGPRSSPPCARAAGSGTWRPRRPRSRPACELLRSSRRQR